MLALGLQRHCLALVRTRVSRLVRVAVYDDVETLFDACLVHGGELLTQRLHSRAGDC